jgi:hypothetical protein
MRATTDRIVATINRQKRFNARDLVQAVLLAGAMIATIAALL